VGDDNEEIKELFNRTCRQVERCIKNFLEANYGKASNSSRFSSSLEQLSRAASGENSTPDEKIHSYPVYSENAKAEQQESEIGCSMVGFTIKEDVKLEDLLMIKSELMLAFSLFRIFADRNNLPVNVTSVISDREDVVAVSRTHEEGRAIDISTKGWPEHKIREAVEYMLYKDKEEMIGAVSLSDGQRRIIIHHEYMGQGDHFHLQVSK